MFSLIRTEWSELDGYKLLTFYRVTLNFIAEVHFKAIWLPIVNLSANAKCFITLAIDD